MRRLEAEGVGRDVGFEQQCDVGGVAGDALDERVQRLDACDQRGVGLGGGGDE